MYPALTTSNTQLDNIGRHLFNHIYKNAIANGDTLPPISRTMDIFYILNIQPRADGNGTHWVAVLHEKDRPFIEYFDSYGLPPVAAMRRRYKLPIHYNDHRVQHFEATSCGYHCLMYAYNRFVRHLSQYDCLYKIYNLQRFDKNEEAVMRFIRAHNLDPQAARIV